MNKTIEYQDICKTCPRVFPSDAAASPEIDADVNREYKSSLFCMIFSNKEELQMLPTPRYIVFYNGTEIQPDKVTLRLSDAFEVGNGCLECEATMLNINYGRNKELMNKCRRLEEYAIFVDRVRTYATKMKNLSKAVNQAIDECIQEDILRDILTQFRAEVHAMVLTTFDKELYESNLKKDAYTDGMELPKENPSKPLLMNWRNPWKRLKD